MKKVLTFVWELWVSASVSLFFATVVWFGVERIVFILSDRWDESIGYRVWPLFFFLSACTVGGIVYVYGLRLFKKVLPAAITPGKVETTKPGKIRRTVRRK